MSTSTEPRIRFNWGFWDAQSGPLPDWWQKRERHFDRIYVNGYEYGYHARGSKPTTSDDAWRDFQSVIKSRSVRGRIRLA